MENPSTNAPAKQQQALVLERPVLDARIRAQAARALTKKKAASGKKDKGPASRKEISNGPSTQLPPPADEIQETATPSSPLEPQRKKVKITPIVAVETDEEFQARLQQMRTESEAQWREMGAIPLLQDFAAVKRLCENGEAFFREAYVDLPVRLARAFRGNIQVTNTETSFFNHQLRIVHKQFESLNIGRYFEVSSENQALKAQAEELSGAQAELDKVHAALAEKEKLLESLPSMQSELERATSSVKDLKKWNEELAASVENLKVELFATEGFTQCFKVSCVLAPFIEPTYYDMLHTGEDDKIWKDGQVVITGEAYREKVAQEATLTAGVISAF